jgi:hypothetical protein
MGLFGRQRCADPREAAKIDEYARTLLRSKMPIGI